MCNQNNLFSESKFHSDKIEDAMFLKNGNQILLFKAKRK